MKPELLLGNIRIVLRLLTNFFYFSFLFQKKVKYEQVINKTKFEKQKGISWIVNAAELQIVKSNFSYEYVRVELMYPS